MAETVQLVPEKDLPSVDRSPNGLGLIAQGVVSLSNMFGPRFPGPLQDAVNRNVWTFDAWDRGDFVYDPEGAKRRAEAVQGVVEGPAVMPKRTNLTDFRTPLHKGEVGYVELDPKLVRGSINRDRTRNGRNPKAALSDEEFKRMGL